MNKVYIVGAGPGAPDLITVRGMDLLRKADVLIYAGSLVNPALVEESGAALKLDSQNMKLDEIVGAIEEHVRAGRLVVRLHSRGGPGGAQDADDPPGRLREPGHHPAGGGDA